MKSGDSEKRKKEKKYIYIRGPSLRFIEYNKIAGIDRVCKPVRASILLAPDPDEKSTDRIFRFERDGFLAISGSIGWTKVGPINFVSFPRN